MSSDAVVEHKGIVIAIDGSKISVEILNKSLCESCHAKGACTAGDIKIKNIDVITTESANYLVGENVNLVMKRYLGFKAVLIFYVIPLIILLVLLLSLSEIAVREPVSALFAVASVAIYYFIVFLSRKRFANEFVFSIEKLI